MALAQTSGAQHGQMSVISRAARRFPDRRVDAAFTICMPVYELRLKVTELAEHTLSTASRFVLQLVGIGISDANELAKLLGISKDHVVTAAAELLGGELVVQRPDTGLRITDKGRTVLSEGGRSLRPRNRHPRVPYDPLTRRIVDMDIDRLLDRRVVQEGGLFVLPTSPRKPRIGALGIDDIREYVQTYGKSRSKAELVSVSDIKEARLRYRSDIVVVKLSADNVQNESFAAYRAHQYLEEESAALQRLADAGVDIMPEESKTIRSAPWEASIAVSREERSLLDDIDKLDRAVGEIEQAAAVAEVTRGTTQSEGERRQLTSQLAELEKQEQEIRLKLSEQERKLSEIRSGETKLIKTEEHRELLC